MGALVNGVVLLVGGGLVLAYCVPRLAEPVQPEAHGMLALALFGVLVNGVAALRIRKGTTLNERVAALHLLEDVLGWVAVLIVSVVMLFADVPILDPLLSLLVTLWVGYNAARNVKKTVDLFLQAVPEDVDVQGLREVALSQTGVRDLRHVHVWSLEGERHVLTGHLEVEPATLEEAVALRERVSAALREAGIEHATLQLELPDAAAPQDSPELRQDPASE